MDAIVTHSDADGIISAALLYKLYPNNSLFFSSNQYLLRTLCNLVSKDYKNIKILDIAPNKKSLIIASIFDEVIWIDHHKIDNFEIPSNIKLINEECESAAKLVAKTFKIENRIVEIANEIDTNNVKSSEAEFFRSLISAIKWKFKEYQTIKFKQIVKILAFKDFSDLEKIELFSLITEEYKKWLEENINKALSTLRIFEIKNRKIFIVESFHGIPVYEIYNRLLESENFDLLAVIYRKVDRIKKKIISKIEFRDRNENKAIEIAKIFNGGGHKNAAGCIVNYYITFDELAKKIEEVLKDNF